MAHHTMHNSEQDRPTEDGFEPADPAQFTATSHTDETELDQLLDDDGDEWTDSAWTDGDWHEGIWFDIDYNDDTGMIELAVGATEDSGLITELSAPDLVDLVAAVKSARTQQRNDASEPAGQGDDYEREPVRRFRSGRVLRDPAGLRHADGEHLEERINQRYEPLRNSLTKIVPDEYLPEHIPAQKVFWWIMGVLLFASLVAAMVANL